MSNPNSTAAQTSLSDLAQRCNSTFTGYWLCECSPENPYANWYLVLLHGKIVLSTHQKLSGKVLLDIAQRYSPSLHSQFAQSTIAQLLDQIASTDNQRSKSPAESLCLDLEKLCELGFLNRSEIARASRLNLLSDFDRYMAQPGAIAQASFVSEPRLAEQLADLPSFTFDELLNDSQTRQKDWQQIKRLIPDMAGKPILQAEAVARSPLNATQKQRLRHLVLLGATLADIAAAVAEDPLTIAQVFAKLIEEGLVTLQLPSGETIAPAQSEIIVIDDSALVLQQFDGLARQWGYRVKLISNPLKAVDEMLLSPPAIVFLDVNMPEMTGFDLVKAIRYEPHLQQVPLVILTAERSLNNNWQARWSGCQFLSKPNASEEVPHFQLKLKAMIETALLNLASKTAPQPTAASSTATKDSLSAGSRNKGTIVSA
jgi:CheY-like chemotaxis protein